jgi:hypothetical protein
MAFIIEEPEGVTVSRRAANSMYTHFRWLWYVLDPRHSKYRTPEQFWRSIHQIYEGWPGPQLGWDENGDKVFVAPGGLSIADPEWLATFQEEAPGFPALIEEHAAPNLREKYLDNLATYLTYINPEQIPEELRDWMRARGALA